MGKTIFHKGTVTDALSFALSVVQELAEEVREVVDNVEGTGLRETARIQTLDETATSLEGLDEREPPTVVEELDVEWSEFTSKRISRRERRDNAVFALSNVVDALDSWLEDEKNAEAGERDDVEAFKGELEEDIDVLNGCEFPGIRG